MRDLEGRVAIVTGAASGIGRAAAILFQKHGARVCLVDFDRERIEEAYGLLDPTPEALVQIADITEEQSAQTLVEACERILGPPEILFSNAGTIVIKPALAHTLEEWERVMAVNARAGFLLARAVIPAMKRLGRGSIVFTASTDGLVGDYELAAYCASKGAVIQLARVLAIEHARDNIRVNALAPGITETPMQMAVIESTGDPREAIALRNRLTPLGRMLRPEEIAEAALFLASDRSSAMTGQTLVVDGGLTACWMNPPDAYVDRSGSAA